ncbi:MAG: hypothetical protein ACUVXJ_05335 [Phycisphaerae bacterium]
MGKGDRGQYVIERAEAQRSATLIQSAALLGVLVCVTLAALLQDPINRRREDLQLVMHSDIYKELPPEYGWISAFGGPLRGLAVHYFWYRAEELKQEGKYYESQQLARWICTLQPRFAQVWIFQAWNMSYNISVATHTPQERWQWVYNGIRLLRDEGIPNNDRVIALYRELTWIIFHKLGDRIDEFHNFYKRRWAATMENLLGPPPVGVSDEKMLDWFRPVAEAPVQLEDVIAKRPRVAEIVKTLGDLGIDVRGTTTNDKVFHPLETLFFEPYARFLLEKDMTRLRDRPVEMSESERRLNEFFVASAGEDFDALLAWLRAKVLREQYKMDPAFMLSMTEKLGTAKPIPLDWRTPWTHAIYWSMYGMKKGEEVHNVQEIDRLNTDRVMLYGLQNLARMGRYIFRNNPDEPFRSFLEMGPDLHFVEAMHNKYIELGKKYAEPDENVENRTCEMLRDGHVNFLEEAVMNFYFAGRNDEARHYLDYLAKHYPDPNTNQPKEIYFKTVDEFMNNRIGEIIDTQPSAIALIGNLLRRGYLALAGGNSDEFGVAVRRAAAIYQRYQEDAVSSEMNRLRLPRFESIRAGALFRFLADATIPLYVRSFVWRYEGMTEEDDLVRKYCYHFDMPGLLKALGEECAEERIDMKLAFPEPSGIEQWLKNNPAPVLQEDLNKAEAGAGKEG